MNYDALQYFVCVAKEESITKASQQLHISQPALSGIIAAMEKEMGTELFERKRHKVTLTDAGKIYLDYANKILDIQRAGIKKFGNSEKIEGILRISMGCNSDSTMRIFSQFHKKYPDVRLQVYSQQLQADGEKSYKMDFRVVPHIEAEGMQQIEIAMAKQLYAVMREDHPLAKNKILDFKDLKTEKFIFSIDETGELEPVYQYCLSSGLKPNISFYYENLQYQIEMVLHTGAIAITYNTFRRFRGGLGGVVSIPVNYKGAISDGIVMAWNPENTNPLIPLMVECAGSH